MLLQVRRAAKVEAEEHKKVIAIRLLVGLPPIVGAMITHKLATVLDYTGVLGLVIALVMPAILWERSLRAMVFIWGLPGASSSLPRLPREAGGPCAKPGSRVEDEDRALLVGTLQWILGSHEPDPADQSLELRQVHDVDRTAATATPPADAQGESTERQPRIQEVLGVIPQASQHPLQSFPKCVHLSCLATVFARIECNRSRFE